MKKLYDVKIEHVVRVLEHTSGNKTKAAIVLGISLRTLRNILASDYRLKKFHMTREQYLKKLEEQTYG